MKVVVRRLGTAGQTHTSTSPELLAAAVHVDPNQLPPLIMPVWSKEDTLKAIGILFFAGLFIYAITALFEAEEKARERAIAREKAAAAKSS